MSAFIVHDNVVNDAYDKLPADIRDQLKSDENSLAVNEEEVPIIFTLWARESNKDFLRERNMKELLTASFLISFSWVGKLLKPIRNKEAIKSAVESIRRVNWFIKQSPWSYALLLDYKTAVLDRKSVTQTEFFELLFLDTHGLCNDTFPFLHGLFLSALNGAAGIVQWLWETKPLGGIVEDCRKEFALATKRDGKREIRTAIFSSTGCFPMHIRPNNIVLSEPMRKFLESSQIPLKSCRFTLLSGRRLFLSEIRNKSAEDLGIKTGDVVICENLNQSTDAMLHDFLSEHALHEEPKQQHGLVASGSGTANHAAGRNSRPVNRKKMKQRAKKSRRAVCAEPAAAKRLPSDRLRHSKKLSRVHEEADDILRGIRRQLNDLNLKRTPPKHVRQKKSSAVSSSVAETDVSVGFDQSTEGGKAGRIFYDVKVGDAACLYKTSKPSRRAPQLDRDSVASAYVLDLHGCTRDEGRDRLDTCLPEWTRTAMEGSHPWVLRVRIVCGGGNQILSEMVEDWIKQNDSVAKLFGR